MNTLKSLTTAAITCSILSVVSFNSHAMDKYIETALIDVCKSTLTNSVTKFQKVATSYNLPDKTVAMKVICNGDDIITFAQKYGANKTAARLERSVSGNVNIIDMAAVEKTNVNFQL
ncbi:MAG: hypothetical protein ACI89T_002258 [Cognaticolwellia sp.]|jgi:hypothetical protein